MADMTAAGATRRSALEGRASVKFGQFAIAMAADAARFILRAEPTDAARAGAALGLALPERLRAVFGKTRVAAWLGPDEWLFVAPEEDPAALAQTLETALRDAPHSLVDISHRQIGLKLTGFAAARALNAGCPLDLSEAAFPIGMGTRTILAKCEIVLWRRGPQEFHVEVWRSFADYAAAFLAEAARRAP